MAANDAVSMNVAENRQNVPMAIQENRAAVPMTVAEGGGTPGGLNRKADKVTGAAAGNLAGLDSTGNLTDSGKAPGDFLEAPASAGTQGQVLTADGEGGASWQDPTGGDPTEIIDDEAGSGDTDKVWSADKSHELLTEIAKGQPTATNSDIGKFLKLKSIDQNGKPTEFEYGEGGGGYVDPAVIAEAVDDWLDEHPEATTTVQDGSITVSKLDSDLQSDIETAYSHELVVEVDGWEDPNVTYETGYIDGNGAVNSSSSFRHTNYIPCSEGETIYYNLYGHSTSVKIVAFFNSSKRLVSVITGKSGYTEGTTTVPANTAYVIFSTSNSYLGSFAISNYQRVSGDTLVSNLKSYTDDKTSIDQTGIVLDRSNIAIISGSIFTNQPDGLYSLSAGRRTDYIPVSEGDVVSYRCSSYIGSSVKTYTIAAFDSSKTLVSHIKGEESGVISGTYTVPSGVAYVMISWIWSMQEDGWFSIASASYPRSLEDFIKDKDIAEDSVLNGKQWCCLGDSITYGADTTKTYFNFISDRCGVTPWNFGKSNTCIAKPSVSTTDNMATRYEDMFSDVDFVTVFGGTNDHGNNINIGQWGDADQLTLYGAMKVLCEGLVTKYTGKKIGFILPLPKYRLVGGVYTDYSYPSTSFKPYVDCIHDVCKRYSIPVLDLYTESGLAVANSDVRTALIPDGLHPNATGHEFISRKIQTFLESL